MRAVRSWRGRDEVDAMTGALLNSRLDNPSTEVVYRSKQNSSIPLSLEKTKVVNKKLSAESVSDFRNQYERDIRGIEPLYRSTMIHSIDFVIGSRESDAIIARYLISLELLKEKINVFLEKYSSKKQFISQIYKDNFIGFFANLLPLIELNQILFKSFYHFCIAPYQEKVLERYEVAHEGFKLLYKFIFRVSDVSPDYFDTETKELFLKILDYYLPLKSISLDELNDIFQEEDDLSDDEISQINRYIYEIVVKFAVPISNKIFGLKDKRNFSRSVSAKEYTSKPSDSNTYRAIQSCLDVWDDWSEAMDTLARI